MTLGRSKLAKKAREIQFHSDGYSIHPAINVKWYGSLRNIPEYLTEEQVQCAYNDALESWWDAATELAHEHGYSGVFQQGRMGGWLVPFFQYGTDGKLAKFLDWPGQGGSKGYPSFPDVEDSTQRKQFIRFQSAILRLYDKFPAMYQAAIDDLAATVQEHASEMWQEEHLVGSGRMQ